MTSFESSGSPEQEERERIVNSNLELMKTDMRKLLAEESWGGNAGFHEEGGKRYLAAIANFWFRKASGEIVQFTNDPVELAEDPELAEAFFRLAQMFRKEDVVKFEPQLIRSRSLAKVVDFGFRDETGVSDQAVDVLNRTQDKWNEEVYIGGEK